MKGQLKNQKQRFHNIFPGVSPAALLTSTLCENTLYFEYFPIIGIRCVLPLIFEINSCHYIEKGNSLVIGNLSDDQY